MVPVATKFPLSLTAKAEYVKPKLKNKKGIRYYWSTQGDYEACWESKANRAQVPRHEKGKETAPPID